MCFDLTGGSVKIMRKFSVNGATTTGPYVLLQILPKMYSPENQVTQLCYAVKRKSK